MGKHETQLLLKLVELLLSLLLLHLRLNRHQLRLTRTEGRIKRLLREVGLFGSSFCQVTRVDARVCDLQSGSSLS